MPELMQLKFNELTPNEKEEIIPMILHKMGLTIYGFKFDGAKDMELYLDKPNLG